MTLRIAALLLVLAVLVCGCGQSNSSDSVRARETATGQKKVTKWRTGSKEPRTLGLVCEQQGAVMNVRLYELGAREGWTEAKALPDPFFDAEKKVYVMPLLALPFMSARDFAVQNIHHMKVAVDPKAEKLVAEYHNAGNQVTKYEFLRYQDNN